MADTFDSRLKLRLQESGANSGQWGTLLNQTVTNIASVFGFGTHQLTSDADATLTLSDDGASLDALKSSYLKITSSVSLTATRTLTFSPNTFNQVKYIENATSGSQSITISQGSGANVTIESGATKVVYFDGAGSGAAVVDALANIDQGTAEFDTIRVSTIKANDGTASSTIADSTGVMTIASAVLTTADINAGTIDNTVLGGSTAAAGSFTTLQASTSLNVDGSVTADGLTVDLTDNAGVLLQSPNDTSTAFLKFGDSTSSDSGSISYDHYNDALRFKTINKNRLRLDSNGDVSFYEDTGTTQALFWDASSESLGIGTTPDPDSGLHLKGDGKRFFIDSNDYNLVSLGRASSSGAGLDTAYFRMKNAGTNSVIIHAGGDSYFNGGNVGIGSSSGRLMSGYDANSKTLTVYDSDGSAQSGYLELAALANNNGYNAGAIAFINDANSNNSAPENAGSKLVAQIRAETVTSDTNAGDDAGADLVMFTKPEAGGLAERMRIDSRGTLALGTTNTHQWSVFDGRIRLGATACFASTSNSTQMLSNAYFDGSYRYITTDEASRYYQSGGSHHWETAASGSADAAITFSEAMALTSGGVLEVGGTAKFASWSNSGASNGIEIRSTDGQILNSHTGTSLHVYQYFYNANGIVGSISASGSSTAFNTSSDYRLKENVVAMTGATERLKQLLPKRFNFIADADTTIDGFLAHEVAGVVPEAITGAHNEVDDDGNPVYQGIDQSKLVPLLVATIQELEARITQLENN